MITVTPAAAKQIKLSAEQSSMQGIPLRIAIKTEENDGFHYAMGFDEQRLPGDEFINTEEVSLVVSIDSQPLAQGLTIDFVELEPDTFEFIFLNPMDPSYVAPA